MPNPVTALLSRCKIGFAPLQKMVLCFLLLLYVVSPIDLFPVVFFPIDDFGALYLLLKVLRSPTLPPAGGGPPGSARAHVLVASEPAVPAPVRAGQEMVSRTESEVAS